MSYRLSIWHDEVAKTSQVAERINLSAHDSWEHKVDINWKCVSAPHDFMKYFHQIIDIAEA
jgi:hypothetical protein